MATATQDFSSHHQAKGSDDMNDEFVENFETVQRHGTYYGNATAHLTEEHRQYLLRIHGTLELEPIPDMSDADPYNWPAWKVRTLNDTSLYQTNTL